MTDITLRDYLKHIDDYIKENRLEEATAHSAHILQRFPKNAAAYRFSICPTIALTSVDNIVCRPFPRTVWSFAGA